MIRGIGGSSVADMSRMTANMGALTVLLWLLGRHVVHAAQGGQPLPVRTLYQRRALWQDHSVLLSAVQAGTPVTAAHFVPEASPRAPKLLVAGDRGGSLHLLASDGTLLGSYPSGSGGGVSAITSYRLARNATVLLTGHETGEARLFLVRGAGAERRAERNEDPEAQPNVELQLLTILHPEELLCTQAAAAAAAAAAAGRTEAGSAVSGGGASSVSGPCAPITQLGAAGGKSGRGPMGLVSAVSAAGGVAVIRLEGRQQPGAVRVTQRVHSDAPILAARAYQAALTLLGPEGVAALPAGTAPGGAAAPGQQGPGPASPLLGPGGGLQLQWSPCSSLNGSALLAAVFQEPQGHSAYAVTDAGRLALLVLSGNGGKKGCQVRSWVRLPSQLAAAASSHTPPPLSLSLLKGYLLLTSPAHLAVYNISNGLSRRPPRLVLDQELALLSHKFMQPSPGGPSLVGETALGGEGRSGEEHGLTLAQAQGMWFPSGTGSSASSSGGGRELMGTARVGGGGGAMTQASGAAAGAPACQAGGSSSGDGAWEACSAPGAPAAAAAGQACTAGSGLLGGSGGDSTDVSPPAAPAAAAAATAAPLPPGPQPPPTPGSPWQQQLALLVTDGGRLVALGFGGGVVAVYESSMAQRVKPPPPAGAALLQFMQPMAIIGVAGIVLWRARNRREAMAGAGPGGARGSRDSMGEFERLLRGNATGRRGAFGRFDPQSDEDGDLGPMLPPVGRICPPQPGRRPPGEGRPAGAAAATRGGGDSRGAGSVRGARRERVLGARGGSSLDVGFGGTWPGGGLGLPGGPRAPPGAPNAGADRVASQPQPAGPVLGPLAGEESDSEVEGEGARQQLLHSGAAGAGRPPPQKQFDYAPLPEGHTAPGSLGEGASGSDADDFDEDWCDTPLLAGGGAASDGSGAAALAELRQQYGISDE